MIYRIVFFLFFFMNLFCTQGNSQEKVMSNQLHPIPRPLSPPANFSDYLGNFFQGKYGEENLKQWIAVHDRLFADFTKWEALGSEEKIKLEDAYISQWALLLAGSETITDDETRRKIYDKFKDTLLQNGRHQASMLYVFNSRIPMLYTTSRYESTAHPTFAEFYDYIKKDFWKLLERAKDAAVISNMCVIAMAMDENNPAEGNWSKIASKKAALAKQQITSETAMALIEIHFAENARNVRAEAKKRDPTPPTPAGVAMPQQLPDAHCPTIGRLVDMERKMQIEGGMRPPYKKMIQRMVEGNSPEIRW